ncbi:hypothetical protein M514_14654 [Trichuris suis]|uniref:Uncharacterized protein n=1 Tax=Trichuris suis TaxID=68888 RepID=A0A085NV18_9BILA|nr:hypothetical protein M514_14654 [Trichuris suis]
MTIVAADLSPLAGDFGDMPFACTVHLSVDDMTLMETKALKEVLAIIWQTADGRIIDTVRRVSNEVSQWKSKYLEFFLRLQNWFIRSWIPMRVLIQGLDPIPRFKAFDISAFQELL